MFDGGWGVWIVAAVVLLLVLVLVAARQAFRPQLDPQRMFSSAQRREIFGRAGGTCEHKPLWWWRCSQVASHADHVFPWSKGGMTHVANGQAMCAKHNLRKSDWKPTRLYLWRLAHRRATYFPHGTQRHVVWRLNRTVRS